jgi:redox-sensing transcriptional repressor
VSTAKTLGQAPDDADPDAQARADAPPPPLELPPGGAPGAAKGIPESTVARLPVYLRALHQLSASGLDTVSSGTLAESAGVSPAQLRKDLSYLGSYGTRGVGYDVAYLRFEISRVVGSSHEWPVVVVGIGNLGTALANYSGFYSRGFRVVGLVDPSPDLVGKQIHGLAITDLTELEDVVARTGAVIGVIATPAEAAQAVADRLVRLGVTSILNFAATVLAVPDGVTVRKVDLGQELQILAYHEHRKAEELSKTDRHHADARGMIDLVGRDGAQVPPLLAEIVHSGEKDV